MGKSMWLFIIGAVLLLIAWGGELGLIFMHLLFDCSFGTSGGAECPDPAYEPIVSFFGSWVLTMLFSLGIVALSIAAAILWLAGLLIFISDRR